MLFPICIVEYGTRVLKTQELQIPKENNCLHFLLSPSNLSV